MNTRRLVRYLPILLLTLFPFLFATTTFAHAVPKQAGQITEYALPTGAVPRGITSGSDGNIWFGDMGTDKIGRVTPQGSVTEFPTRACCPSDITSGPNGALWYVVGLIKSRETASYIGEITTQGKAKLYPIFTRDHRTLFSITMGSDGNLWFIGFNVNVRYPADGFVGRMTPSGKLTFVQLGANSTPVAITSGPDGNLWVTESDRSFIGLVQVNLSTLKLKRYAMPHGDPFDITSGPDGNLWFTNYTPGKIGEFNLSTSQFSTYAIPTADSQPRGITSGPDGNLWFTESGGNKIGRISPTSHTITEFPIPTSGSFTTDITVGSDGNLWFTETATGKIGKITAA